MGRTLLLLRHAKSSWAQPELADAERPLAPRGRKAAAKIARHMRERGWRPDLVLCSPAVRVQETWRLVAPDLGPDVALKTLRTLYLAPPSRLLDALRRTSDDVGILLMIGHSPGLAGLALRLSGAGPRKALGRMAEKFPTAALAVIGFDVERWAEVAPGAGHLVAFVRPKDVS